MIFCEPSNFFEDFLNFSDNRPGTPPRDLEILEQLKEVDASDFKDEMSWDMDGYGRLLSGFFHRFHDFYGDLSSSLWIKYDEMI